APPPPTVDAARWPDVARRPTAGRASTAVARHLVRRAVDRLPLTLRTPDGRERGLGGPALHVHDPDAFHRRLAADGLIGFGESYQAGEWDAPDLVAVLTVLARDLATLIPPALQTLRPLWATRQPPGADGTPYHAAANIPRHYDLSDELFALFLDPTMTYSSAVFPTLPATHADLTAAQHHKIDRLLDLAAVGAGTRLLEIGTGWGELALRAAARGARVHTVTLSPAQLATARRRVADAGLADRVTLRLADYREIEGRFDAVVSVEMIEAVGAAHWPTYFRTLDRLLRPGGHIALQAITMPHRRMLASRRTHTWIQKYVFPGGMLPSGHAIDETVARHTGLRVAASTGFAPHYAETLRLWRERFAAHATEVGALGFDDTFRRTWTFYLAYSEAGFRAGYLDVRQLLITGNGAAPTREVRR
ncbi:SAM-dependent methyltransferase, partial [Streptomyces hainanensis]